MSDKKEFMKLENGSDPVEISLEKTGPKLGKALACKIVPMSLNSQQKVIGGATLSNGNIDLSLYTVLVITEHTVDPVFTKEDIPALQNRFPPAVLHEWANKILELSGLLNLDDIKKNSANSPTAATS